jgi:lipopolysaccharide heptosyltransferase II
VAVSDARRRAAPPVRNSVPPVREGWAAARRVLGIRLDNVGDVLMTTPALRALKESGDRRELTLLTSSTGAPLRVHLPFVDAVWCYDAPWVKQSATDISCAADFDTISRLAAGGFDAAVIFTVYSQSALPAALMCRLAGIPLRLAHSRENPYQLLSHWVPETEPAMQVRHEVRRQLDLVRTIGAHTDDERLAFHVRDADRAALARWLPSDGTPLVVIHPGASAASRRWPVERFAMTADALRRGRAVTIAVTGSADESGLVEQVRAAAGGNALPLPGALSIGELGALLEAADLLISNNSGPVHVAAALGTPVVDLYALTNPQHTPWRVPHRTLNIDVPCKYCYKSICPQGHHACLSGVSVDTVLAAAEALLDENHDGVMTVTEPGPIASRQQYP